MSKNIGNIKIKQAAKHLADAQREQSKIEKASRTEAHRVQTTKKNIAGGYQGPLLHRTSFQKDLLASPDYIVPAKTRSPKPAISSTK
jgi:hypothetical protein